MCDDVVCEAAKLSGAICEILPDPEPVDEGVKMGPPGKVLVKIPHDEVAVLIVEREDGKFVLWWFDYIVNEHQEEFDDLPLAVARASVLLRCVEKEGGGVFSEGPEGFTTKATAFLDSIEEFLNQAVAFLDSSVS